MTCRAKRQLMPGERVTLNYGPAALCNWPLAKRRAYLIDKCGFVCGCEKCEADAAMVLGGTAQKLAPTASSKQNQVRSLRSSAV